MVTAQELLSLELYVLQQCQHMITLGDTVASSHKLKSSLRLQLAELDHLESRIQTAAAQRGWDLPEVQPASKWIAACRFRCRKDTEIAERLIHLHMNNEIRILKCFNRWDHDDDQVQNLCQKYLDCSAISIRQMKPFL